MSVSVPHVIFLFVDGIGLGPPSRDNPFSTLSLPGFARWSGGQSWTNEARPIVRPDHIFRPIDATLGVGGLPQSGTGQASLFTGVNGAALAERHFGPYPHSETKPVLAGQSIFHKVNALSRDGTTNAAFANAYPDEFFQHREETGRWTVTTFCCVNAKVHLRRFEDWKEGRAITADLTGRAWKESLGYDLTPISEAEAADRLVGLAGDHALTVFEYYLTDKAGHSQSHQRAKTVLHSFDRFLDALHERRDPVRHLVVLASDHGNLEDLSTSSHTRNPVPFIASGRGAENFTEAASILDVTPAIVRTLEG